MELNDAANYNLRFRCSPITQRRSLQSLSPSSSIMTSLSSFGLKQRPQNMTEKSLGSLWSAPIWDKAGFPPTPTLAILAPISPLFWTGRQRPSHNWGRRWRWLRWSPSGNCTTSESWIIIALIIPFHTCLFLIFLPLHSMTCNRGELQAGFAAYLWHNQQVFRVFSHI